MMRCSLCGEQAAVEGLGQVDAGLVRCGVLLVRARDHQHPVEVDGHRPAVSGAFLSGNCRARSRVSARAARIARSAFSPEAARVSTRRETVGSEATGPNTAGSARNMPTSARQSPPSATASATSSRTFLGSWSPRLSPRRQCHGYCAVEAGPADRLHQQDRTGLRDHLATVPHRASIHWVEVRLRNQPRDRDQLGLRIRQYSLNKLGSGHAHFLPGIQIALRDDGPARRTFLRRRRPEAVAFICPRSATRSSRLH